MCFIAANSLERSMKSVLFSSFYICVQWGFPVVPRPGRMRTSVPTQVSDVGRPARSLTSTELSREVMGGTAGSRGHIWTTSTSHFQEAECLHQPGELLVLPALSSSSCLSKACPKAPGTRAHQSLFCNCTLGNYGMPEAMPGNWFAAAQLCQCIDVWGGFCYCSGVSQTP